MRQAIIWTSDGLVEFIDAYMRHSASMSWDMII